MRSTPACQPDELAVFPSSVAILSHPALAQASICIYYCVVCIFTPGQVSSAAVLAQGPG